MKKQSSLEEKWNWMTHGLGFLLSIFGLFLLLVNNSNKSKYSIFSILLYSISLLVLYLASTLYHYSKNIELKSKMRTLDHISIYLLIAGTYSPVTLISLSHSKGYIIFSIVWLLAIIGSFLKFFFTGRFEVISILLYLLMGWLIIWDINALIDVVNWKGITFLVLGGITYSLGIIFYALNRLKFNHVIWHLFVLLGSFFHYIFVLEFII